MAVLCRIKNLQLCWPGACLWSQHALVIDAGVCYRLQGANGVGKSTWLQALSGLLPSTLHLTWCSGKMASKIPGFFTILSVDVFAAFTLGEIVSREYLLRQGKVLSSVALNQLLARVALCHLCHMPWHRLSSGQRQMAALLPLWYTECAVWLLDEPWVHLDDVHRLMVEEVLRCHVQSGGAAVVVSHFDFELASASLFLERCSV